MPCAGGQLYSLHWNSIHLVSTSRYVRGFRHPGIRVPRYLRGGCPRSARRPYSVLLLCYRDGFGEEGCPKQPAPALFSTTLVLQRRILRAQKSAPALYSTTFVLLQLAQATPIERALLRSEAGLGARAFLGAIPSGPGRVEPAAFPRSCGSVCTCRCATASWAAANALSVTTRCGTSYSSGCKEPACDQKRTSWTAASPRTCNLRVGGRQTSSSLPWQDLLLHLTSPLQRPSGRRSSPRLARTHVRQLLLTPVTRRSASRQPKPVSRKVLRSFL